MDAVDYIKALIEQSDDEADRQLMAMCLFVHVDFQMRGNLSPEEKQAEERQFNEIVATYDRLQAAKQAQQ